MMTANDPPIADVHAALMNHAYPPVFVELHFDIHPAPAPAPGSVPGSESDERRAMSDEKTETPSHPIRNQKSEIRNSSASGRYVLSIRNGKPTVQRGGTGHIRLDIDAFTALVHHRATPAELRQTRRLAADDETLAALTAAFPRP